MSKKCEKEEKDEREKIKKCLSKDNQDGGLHSLPHMIMPGQRCQPGPPRAHAQHAHAHVPAIAFVTSQAPGSTRRMPSATRRMRRIT